MDDELLLLTADRHGVFSTADARSMGYTSRTITRMVHERHWVRLRHGWYALASTWRDADERARHLLVARAVLRPLQGQVALAGTSGAVARRLELWQQPLDLIRVVRLDGRSGGIEAGVQHYDRPAGMGDPLRLDDDLWVAPGPWLVGAAMTEAPSLESAVVVADSGLNQGLTSKDELIELVESWQRWPSSRRTRLAARLTDDGAANGGESLGRVLVFWRHGIPAPLTQFEVRGPDGQVARTDWAWPELGVLGELDGKRKYLRDLKPGEDAGEVVWREKLREEWVTDVTGTLMRRMTFGDIFRPARTAAYFKAGFGLARRRGLGTRSTATPVPLTRAEVR